MVMAAVRSQRLKRGEKRRKMNTILKCEPWRKIPSEEKEEEGRGGEEEDDDDDDDDDENMQRESNRTRKRSNSTACEGRAKN